MPSRDGEVASHSEPAMSYANQPTDPSVPMHPSVTFADNSNTAASTMHSATTTLHDSSNAPPEDAANRNLGDTMSSAKSSSSDLSFLNTNDFTRGNSDGSGCIRSILGDEVGAPSTAPVDGQEVTRPKTDEMPIQMANSTMSSNTTETASNEHMSTSNFALGSNSMNNNRGMNSGKSEGAAFAGKNSSVNNNFNTISAGYNDASSYAMESAAMSSSSDGNAYAGNQFSYNNVTNNNNNDAATNVGTSNDLTLDGGWGSDGIDSNAKRDDSDGSSSPPRLRDCNPMSMNSPNGASSQQTNTSNNDSINVNDSDSDSDIVEVTKPDYWKEKPPSAAPQIDSYAPTTLGTSGAAASFQSRKQQIPQWMANNSSNNGFASNHFSHSINSNVNDHYNSTSQGSSYNSGEASIQSRVNNTYSAPSHARDNTSSYPQPSYIQIRKMHLPEGHTPTWATILPVDYFTARLHIVDQQERRLSLTLINMWEFTITMEGSGVHFSGLRAQIKKIARDHVGQGGRKGAVFERGAGGDGIVPDDPILKSATADIDNYGQQGGGGKWRIPLGAYQALMTFLTSDRKNVVEGIPPEQLRAATLGRERMDKSYPKAKELISRGVGVGVAKALAPYQRGGVEFILDKEGRALLADEMGLGKTVQAIAAMSAYRHEWPLLVLCPSTARYHWEIEFRHWLGKASLAKGSDDVDECVGGEKKSGDDDSVSIEANAAVLKNSEINVLTSGKDYILRYDGTTKVVICSLGLIVALVNNERIYPGMFKCVIVDESHALKNKSSKRTQSVVPLLKAADRCLLLSGTPALARPSELWPQLSVLSGRRNGGDDDETPGIWINEDDFYAKYTRGEKGEPDSGTRARWVSCSSYADASLWSLVRTNFFVILLNFAG